LAGALGGSTFDPERLLWVPGRKVWSIPQRIVRVPVETTIVENCMMLLFDWNGRKHHVCTFQ